MRFLIKNMIFLAGLFILSSAHADELDMSSEDFLDSGVLPVLYTCDGKGVSPQLSWTNAAKNAKSFALIFSDKDTKPTELYHWVLYNIPASTTALESDLQKLPAGSATGTNSWDKTTYFSPCPPRGSIHKYVFTLYTLDQKIQLPNNKDAVAVMNAMKGHILQTDTLTAVYSRWPVGAH